jgi:hypothetical protein
MDADEHEPSCNCEFCLMQIIREQDEEIYRLKKLVFDNTAVKVQGGTFWPEWVVEALNPVPKGG